MGGLINFFEFLDGVVGVDLGGCQRGMSEELLDGIKVCAVVKQFRGNRMP